jgi:RHS repeat-associated protein
MDTHKKRQIRKSIGTLLRWFALSLLFASTHAFAQTGGTVTYVYTDPQGTPLAETDASGNITATFEYTPYGTYAPQGTSAPGPAPKGPGYTGHVSDPETNLVYMQARYYDPVTGHFLSIDPVTPSPGDAFNFNRYAYVDNNPIMGMDPTGKDDCGGPACTFMRQISDSFSRVASGAWGDANGSPSGMMTQHAQAAASAMNGAIAAGISDAAATVAPVADAVPGATLGACVAGEKCSGGDWAMGALLVIPGEGEEVDAASLIGKAVHGNSAASKATSYLYRLIDNGGGLLKWGISKNPFRRYTQGFMLDKDMQIMTSGSRREMLNLERWIVERDPGALNREPWAGDKAGGTP